MLSVFERWLVFPAPHANNADLQPAGLVFEDVFFSAEDGTKLNGWYVPHDSPRAVVLYCHGNGEDVPRLANRLKVLHDRIGVAVFAWDYRGYGRSEGTPHEENVVADARAAQLWLAERAGIAPEEVLLMGRSLGGAATIAVASEYPVRGLVLDRTFATLTDAAAVHFPWLPVRWMMRNRFDSVERIAKYQGPLLQTHGTEDEVIPFDHAEELFAASASEQKRFMRVEGANHNGPLPEECYAALDEFLDALP
ncbi:alpha/beta hydrolase [Adhaeretor mobilis]|uniref:Alpha/beta hydrolase family protein n=1 Tax=Adhaeretor mobilis TaxID=1930276 RepID=A0A517N224_9BACT|nr:alpha/beta hydrolase [Adhaeretor mobilis]QDT01196.1 Alpha/beta hydrolase family protein [Adhaeretor mobilis]